MLVLTRQLGEEIYIHGDMYRIKLESFNGESLTLSISSDEDFFINGSQTNNSTITLNEQESFYIDEYIEIMFIDISSLQFRIGGNAPKDISINRREVFERERDRDNYEYEYHIWNAKRRNKFRTFRKELVEAIISGDVDGCVYEDGTKYLSAVRFCTRNYHNGFHVEKVPT